jgi:phospholipase/carboxylesterase
MSVADPHAHAQILNRGAPADRAKATVVALHGRGSTAASIVTLADHVRLPDIAWLAPQAANNAWYPRRFMEPVESNEPWLSSALALVGRIVDGLTTERVVLLGFSQGACLATEFGARNARRYGGVVGLSGGLIGPDGTQWPYPAKLAGTPVFLGCSDVDNHIPRRRVEETARALESLGGAVTARIYPGMGHEINADELAWIRELLEGLPA